MKALTILVLMIALGGCSILAPRPVAVAITLPPMPHELASPCRDPGVRDGEPMLSEFAKSRLALAECRRKHAGAVDFYRNVRSIR
jgi:hypothetical protein